MTRTYNAQSRREKAAQTRDRILACAMELFQQKGLDNTAIQDIAEAADVSAPTIYHLFKSKQGVLLALLDSAFSNTEREQLLEQSTKEMNPLKRFEWVAELCRKLYGAEHQYFELLQGASSLSPEFKQLADSMEARRYTRQAGAVKSAMNEGIFKQNLSEKEALDILWALTGRDMYRMFVIERGWTPEAYEKWLGNSLFVLLGATPN